jgi:hypothetical protein
MRKSPIYNKYYATRSCASVLERSHSALNGACLRSSALNQSILPRGSNESDGVRAMQGSQVYVA